MLARRRGGEFRWAGASEEVVRPSRPRPQSPRAQRPPLGRARPRRSAQDAPPARGALPQSLVFLAIALLALAFALPRDAGPPSPATSSSGGGEHQSRAELTRAVGRAPIAPGATGASVIPGDDRPDRPRTSARRRPRPTARVRRAAHRRSVRPAGSAPVPRRPPPRRPRRAPSDPAVAAAPAPSRRRRAAHRRQRAAARRRARVRALACGSPGTARLA